MSKGIYIGLGSVIFLALVGTLVLFSTWQNGQIESRLVKLDQSINEIKSMKRDLGRIYQEQKTLSRRLEHLKTLPRSASPSVQTAAVPLSQCRNNLLKPIEVKRLPENASMDREASLVRFVRSGSKGFNPLTENAADVSELETYVNLPLADRNPDNLDEWVPKLATCIEVSDDFREYTIHLRRGVYWQRIQSVYLQKHPWLDGEHPVTADDFIYTFEMIMDPAVEGAAPLRSYYKDVEKFEKIDDYTFKVIWKKKTYQSKSFTLGLTAVPKFVYAYDPSGKPYPKATRGQNFNQHWYTHMLGAGPYMMDSFEEGQYVKLVRNPTYYGEEPAFQEIIYKVISDPTQVLAQFNNRELDFITLSPAQYAKEILDAGQDGKFVRCSGGKDCTLKTGQFGYDIFPRMSYIYIGWNPSKPFFADKRVRRAMTHAMDRQKILKEIFNNLGEITTGNFYPASPEYNHEIEPYAYDLEKAKELLDEAGWIDRDGDGIRDKDGVKFEFTMETWSSSPAAINMVKYYKDDLAKIGIKMNIDPLDWSLMQTKMSAREFDAYTGGWALGWESDPYQIWHSSQADLPESSNYVSFKNKEADEIIEKARVTFDPQKRIELFHRFHEIIHEEQPYTFLFTGKSVGAWQPDMKHMVFQKIRPHDLALAWYKALP